FVTSSTMVLLARAAAHDYSKEPRNSLGRVTKTLNRHRTAQGEASNRATFRRAGARRAVPGASLLPRIQSLAVSGRAQATHVSLDRGHRAARPLERGDARAGPVANAPG